MSQYVRFVPQGDICAGSNLTSPAAPWQPHRKHRALARLARHGHVAAHHAHHERELARARKAEPGAPVAARRERIGLGEILEQLRLLLGGDPDASVGD